MRFCLIVAIWLTYYGLGDRVSSFLTLDHWDLGISTVLCLGLDASWAEKKGGDRA